MGMEENGNVKAQEWTGNGREMGLKNIERSRWNIRNGNGFCDWNMNGRQRKGKGRERGRKERDQREMGEK